MMMGNFRIFRPILCCRSRQTEAEVDMVTIVFLVEYRRGAKYDTKVGVGWIGLRIIAKVDFYNSDSWSQYSFRNNSANIRVHGLDIDFFRFPFIKLFVEPHVVSQNKVSWIMKVGIYWRIECIHVLSPSYDKEETSCFHYWLACEAQLSIFLLRHIFLLITNP